MLGELKGGEAWELLMAGTLGIGVVAAVHTEDTAGALEALAVCATKAVPATPFEQLEARFAAMFDVVIYCDIDDAGDAVQRQVTEISVVPPQLSTTGSGVAVTPISPATTSVSQWSCVAARSENAWNVVATACWPATGWTWQRC